MSAFGPPEVAEIAGKRDVGGLIRALGYRKDLYVRMSAARALGQIGGLRAVEPLIHALADPQEVRRTAAAEALGSLGDVGSPGRPSPRSGTGISTCPGARSALSAISVPQLPSSSAPRSTIRANTSASPLQGSLERWPSDLGISDN